MPFEEISEATGLPVGTAKCYAHRGRERACGARAQRMMDKAAIEAVLPHRDPMLLIDEVIELVAGERVVARKTVTEEDCAGHFPGQPDHAGREDGRGARAVRRGRGALAEENERQARALRRHRRRALQAGRSARATCSTLECQVETVRGPIGAGKVRATVDGELAVRGTLTFAVGDEQ